MQEGFKIRQITVLATQVMVALFYFHNHYARTASHFLPFLISTALFQM